MHRPLLVLCVIAGTAAAQAPKPNQAEADKYFAEGRDLLVNKNDAAAACVAFEKAIELDPTAPGVMLNLGLCYEVQGKYAMSLHWFRKAANAAAEAQPPLPEYEAEAKLHTGPLASKVAITQLRNVPPDARVSIDGRAVPRAEFARLEVDVDSVIEVRAPGKRAFRQKVEVTGTSGKEIVVVMQDEIVSDPGKGRRRLAYVVGAGGVVLWGASLAYGLVVRSRYEDTMDEHYQGAGGFKDAKSDLQWKATSVFVAGSAAIGAAIYLYVTAPKYRDGDQARITPVLAPDHVGFGYGGTF
ncbi:MAG: hypothetical protein M4D80_39990 [Myxococcota bacterium]|nr:hypothetical protein [Deltaproteobacteria bacterium]MDQ3341377.1 hypothetical protein [Myxococcota bacterium]